MKKYKCINSVWEFRKGEVYEMLPCGESGYSYEEKVDSPIIQSVIHSISKESIKMYFVELK
jgi:hypothetical protein